MSWNVQKVFERTTFEKDALLIESMEPSYELEMEAQDELHAAQEAAVALLKCSCYDDAAELNVTLSGHANPARNSSADFVGVQMFVSKYRPPEKAGTG